MEKRGKGGRQEEREKRGRREGEEREKRGRREGEEREKRGRREGEEREKRGRRGGEEGEKRGRREGEESRKVEEFKGGDLLICFIADLHPALNEGVVIVEEELGDVPEHTSMQQLVLEPAVHCKCSHCLHSNAVQTSQVLEGGTMPL